MSGFFSLGSGNNKDQEFQQHKDSFFLFKNEEIYKGFELWQQYHNLHHQRLHNFQDLDFSVGPTASSSSTDNNRRIYSGNIVISGDDSSCYSYRVTRPGGGSKKSANAGMNCQDCGNQAKKDCSHLRCRTCCKSRGFSCPTHLKSTWVPAAKRRERQQQQLAALQQDRHVLTVRGENPKRLRDDAGITTTSGFEFGHFPPEVNSPAVFRCVRVSSMDDTAEHFAYQTSVNIGGHVFKGILYDQGREIRYPCGGGDQGSSGHQPPLNLTTVATASHPNVTMLDPSINYPTPMYSFTPGTQFFSPPRP